MTTLAPQPEPSHDGTATRPGTSSDAATPRLGQQVPDRWTVLSMIQWSTDYLVAKGFDEARLHAELLLGHVLNLSRLQLYLKFDRPLNAGELAAFKTLFKRRLDHEPLQYILGEAVFMGFPLAVAPGVLIPRPETELLVERVVEYIRTRRDETVDLIDVGTGSGNIAIAIAHLAPTARVTAIDVSPDAIALARMNVDRHSASRVSLEERDVREGPRAGEKYDIVVSNPPYISLAEYVQLQPEVLSHEPRIALTDEADGLGFHQTLFRFAEGVLRTSGRIFCEIGYGQADAVRALAGEQGIQILEIAADYEGIPRVLIGCPAPPTAEKG